MGKTLLSISKPVACFGQHSQFWVRHSLQSCTVQRPIHLIMIIFFFARTLQSILQVCSWIWQCALKIILHCILQWYLWGYTVTFPSYIAATSDYFHYLLIYQSSSWLIYQLFDPWNIRKFWKLSIIIFQWCFQAQGYFLKTSFFLPCHPVKSPEIFSLWLLLDLHD